MVFGIGMSSKKRVAMRVRCINNVVGNIDDSDVRDRIRRSIHLEGPITDLLIVGEYEVQALEKRDGGLWFYLHSVPANDYPYPYPAELFEVSDSALPAKWNICIQKQGGNVVWRRIAFLAWASDDLFYERLVDGDKETISIYKSEMLRPSANSTCLDNRSVK